MESIFNTYDSQYSNIDGINMNIQSDSQAVVSPYSVTLSVQASTKMKMVQNLAVDNKIFHELHHSQATIDNCT